MQAAEVFFLAALVDVLYVAWVQSAVRGRALRAAAASGGIQMAALLGLLLVIGNPVLVGANVLGHVVGSYAMVKAGSFGDEGEDFEGAGEEATGDRGGHDTWERFSHCGEATGGAL